MRAETTKLKAEGTANRRRENLSDKAYRELKKRILENRLSVGHQYMEQEVAELLKMSRTPIREALIRLANEGLVEIRPRHGMRIKPVSLRDMREIYEILTSLESCAAELAARRGLKERELERLQTTVAEMEHALEIDDLDGWVEADEKFHRLLVEFSDNERLISLVGTFRDQSHRVRMMTLRLRPKPTASNEDHRAVVEAIAEGSPDKARQIHRVHREKSGRLLIDLLETHGLIQV